MHQNRYLGMQISKNFSEDDMPIIRYISVTPHLWYLPDAYDSNRNYVDVNTYNFIYHNINYLDNSNRDANY